MDDIEKYKKYIGSMKKQMEEQKGKQEEYLKEFTTGLSGNYIEGKFTIGEYGKYIEKEGKLKQIDETSNIIFTGKLINTETKAVKVKCIELYEKLAKEGFKYQPDRDNMLKELINNKNTLKDTLKDTLTSSLESKIQNNEKLNIENVVDSFMDKINENTIQKNIDIEKILQDNLGEQKEEEAIKKEEEEAIKKNIDELISSNRDTFISVLNALDALIKKAEAEEKKVAPVAPEAEKAEAEEKKVAPVAEKVAGGGEAASPQPPSPPDDIDEKIVHLKTRIQQLKPTVSNNEAISKRHIFYNIIDALSSGETGGRDYIFLAAIITTYFSLTFSATGKRTEAVISIALAIPACSAFLFRELKKKIKAETILKTQKKQLESLRMELFRTIRDQFKPILQDILPDHLSERSSSEGDRSDTTLVIVRSMNSAQQELMNTELMNTELMMYPQFITDDDVNEKFYGVSNYLVSFLSGLTDHIYDMRVKFYDMRVKYHETVEMTQEAVTDVPNITRDIEDLISDNPQISFVIFHAIRFSFFCARSTIPVAVNTGKLILALIINLHNFLGTRNFTLLIGSALVYYNYSEFIHEMTINALAHWIKQFIIVRIQNLFWNLMDSASDAATNIVRNSLNEFIANNQDAIIQHMVDAIAPAIERAAMTGATNAMTQNAANQAAGNVAQTFISGLIQRAIVNPEQAAEVLTSGAQAVLSLTSGGGGGKTRKRKKRSKKKKQKRRLKTKKRGKTKKRRKSKRRKSRNKK